MREILHTHEIEDRHDAILDMVSRQARPRDPQRVGDVLEDVVVRPDRIGLEHDADLPLMCRHGSSGGGVMDDVPGDLDPSAAGVFEPGNAAQRRCLAAARRAEQGVALPLGHREADRIDSPHVSTVGRE